MSNADGPSPYDEDSPEAELAFARRRAMTVRLTSFTVPLPPPSRTRTRTVTSPTEAGSADVVVTDFPVELENARLLSRALSMAHILRTPSFPVLAHAIPDLDATLAMAMPKQFEPGESQTQALTNFEVDYQESVQFVQHAVSTVEPHVSAKENREIYDALKLAEDQIRKRVNHRLRLVEDPVVIHEEILQGKVLLFNSWLAQLQQSAELSHPESAEALSSLGDAFRRLFRDYPGFVSLDADVSSSDDEEMVIANVAPGDATTTPLALRPELASVIDDDDAGDTVIRRPVNEDAQMKVRARTKTIVAVARPDTDAAPAAPVINTNTIPRKILALLVSAIFAFLPILTWLPRYHRLQLPRAERVVKQFTPSETVKAVLTNLRYDLVSGLTVGVMAVVQSMAYARLAGLAPVSGLHSAFVMGLLYVPFGTCRQAHVGPVALAAVLTQASIEANFGSNVTAAQAALIASALSFLVGIIYMGMGLLRLGFIVAFLSGPVLSGFTTGAAVTIMSTQLAAFFGLKGIHTSEYAWEGVYLTAKALAATQWQSFVIGMCMLILIMFLKNTSPAIPAALIAVVIGTAISYGAGFPAAGVSIIGIIPSGLPSVQIPPLNILGALVKDAVVIALVAFMESISVSKKCSKFFDYDVDANQELRALGVCNIVGSFFGCFPGVGCFGRSAVACSTYARSPLYSIVASITLAVTLVALTALFYCLPASVLAAVVISGVWSLIDFSICKTLWQTNKFDLLVLIISFVATVALGASIGIVLAIAGSFILTVYQSSRPHTCIMGRVPGNVIYRDIGRYPEAITIPGIVVLRFDSRIFFGNTGSLKSKVDNIAKLLEKAVQHKALIIDASSVTSVDSQGLEMLGELMNDLARKGILLLFANLDGHAYTDMKNGGLVARLGENKLHWRVHDAVRAVLGGTLTMHSMTDVDGSHFLLDRFVAYVRQKRAERRDSMVPLTPGSAAPIMQA
eukprot:TRINITY_DN3629_c0_g1_i2.p1 TRINITY_DN3629_c0_g1~~TRINITY_DN3629_c0_g1_i2.p1  ORF type:complete len:967 (+),score=194.26 TRINITY_DN3629_c0_g1_i2:52-2952(+)